MISCTYDSLSLLLAALRSMTAADVPSAVELLNGYLSKYSLTPIMNDEVRLNSTLHRLWWVFVLRIIDEIHVLLHLLFYRSWPTGCFPETAWSTVLSSRQTAKSPTSAGKGDALRARLCNYVSLTSCH